MPAAAIAPAVREWSGSTTGRRSRAIAPSRSAQARRAAGVAVRRAVDGRET